MRGVPEQVRRMAEILSKYGVKVDLIVLGDGKYDIFIDVESLALLDQLCKKRKLPDWLMKEIC